jgi:hypothetical protein
VARLLRPRPFASPQLRSSADGDLLEIPCVRDGGESCGGGEACKGVRWESARVPAKQEGVSKRDIHMVGPTGNDREVRVPV